MSDGAVAAAAGLHSVAVDARSTGRREAAFPRLLAAVVVDVLEVKGVQMAGKNPADCDLALEDRGHQGVDCVGEEARRTQAA